LVGFCCKSSLSLVYILKKKENSTLAALPPWASLALVWVGMVMTMAGTTMATAGMAAATADATSGQWLM
jgi:hypothetical protein